MEGKAKSRAKGKAKAFIIEAQPQWYLLVDNLEGHAPMPTASQLADLQTKAASLHVQALAAHSDVGTESSSKDGTFLQKVLQGGTLSDRLSALTLLVQGSPLHNTKALESLKGLAERGRGKGGRDESLKAVRAISDWWIGGGAPMRKLQCVYEEMWTRRWCIDVSQLFSGSTSASPQCHRPTPCCLVF